MRRIRYILFVMLMLSINTVVSSQTYSGNQNDIDEILVNIDKFSSYIMASNYEMIAESYTDDGKIFPNNSEIIEGRTLIKSYWQLPEGVRILHHKLTPSEIKVLGNEAYDYGHYEGKTKRKDGQEVSWKGKYVVVWKKVENEWKIYLDIWNSISD
jgi:ketosteroid isomerase-like protein